MVMKKQRIPYPKSISMKHRYWLVALCSILVISDHPAYTPTRPPTHAAPSQTSEDFEANVTDTHQAHRSIPNSIKFVGV
jgi:hypothetical protein